jgi:hypothetical protein
MTDLAVRVEEDGLLEQVIAQGNLANLTPAQRTSYYGKLCASLNLNPLTRPFEYLTLSGKLVLYARKDATDQLRAKRGVSLAITARETIGDLYVVTARATLPNGRADEEIGAVPIAGLKGEMLANAYMKASTKAKRRVTLSICGLGMLDESEVDSIPDARYGDGALDAPAPRGPAIAAQLDAAIAEADAITQHEQEQQQAGAPGDDVDELIGMELLEACQRMTRRLNARGLDFAPLPTTRTNNALRQWWKLAAAALAATG